MDAQDRFRAVADDVAEAEHSAHGKLVGVGEHCAEGVDVGVDVAEEGEEGVLGFQHVGVLVMEQIGRDANRGAAEGRCPTLAIFCQRLLWWNF